MAYPLNIGVMHDHVLMRNGLVRLLKDFDYEISFQCNNEKELIKHMEKDVPDIILIVINFRAVDNFDSILWLSTHYPQVHVLALSMYNDENVIIRMLENGAKGVLKDSEPEELRNMIEGICTNGYHYSATELGRLVQYIQRLTREGKPLNSALLKEKEIEFLKLAGTEMTYKEIAAKMFISPRTIEGYRNALFEKLNVKSRVGLVLFAIRKGIVTLN